MSGERPDLSSGFLASDLGVSGLGVSSLVASVGDLVLPAQCGGCAAPGIRWCPDCARVLAAAPPAHSWSPSPRPPGLPPVCTVLPYAGPVRTALVSWKDNDRRDLTSKLAPALTEAILAALAVTAVPVGSGSVVAVPVPSARANVRRRGDRPLALLLGAALRPIPRSLRPRVLPVLRLGRPVADQAGLDSAARAANLRGAMTVPAQYARAVQGAFCLVVDDVITTGATLVEAARALDAAGAAGVVAATLAATARHG